MNSKDKNVVVCIISIELLIPMAHSLKEKRKHIKSLKERLQNRFNASVAEVAALDDWQRSVLGVAMISNDRRYLEKQYSSIENFILEIRDIE
ncbi:MAG: DUF503 domain-containing protein, partial [Gammaproteobacteria bacterium]|nr:DUF503 domain-containing protein [Gammaproteobacteria bacterium]